jgi:hypothetical protein
MWAKAQTELRVGVPYLFLLQTRFFHNQLYGEKMISSVIKVYLYRKIRFISAIFLYRKNNTAAPFASPSRAH